MKKWVAIFEVVSLFDEEALRDAAGAFVNVVGLAGRDVLFVEAAISELAASGFAVIGLSGLSSVTYRIAEDQMAPDLVELSEQLSDAQPVLFDTFHSYPEEE